MACNDQSTTATASHGKSENSSTNASSNENYVEGKDYLVYNRVRMLDRKGFTEPQEAYSILLPKDWKTEGEVEWNMPGSGCEGNWSWLKAASPDGKYSIQIYPHQIFIWNEDPMLQQFNQQQNNSGSNCTFGQPMNAEDYLRKVFAAEIGNPQIVSVEPNKFVVEQMQENNERMRTELMRYGSAGVQFNQTAVNAVVRWPDNSEGLVTVGASITENLVPNVYNGTYAKSYSGYAFNKTVFKYPAAEAEQAKNQFGVIMGSVRTNPAWKNTVDKYWKDFREKRHVEHVGKIRMMDEQTRQMGQAAIRKGNERLQQMDTQMRTWEASQSSQDRMHTNFIKTIREVENFRDETGTYEMTSSYNHAWSRGDGTSFVMSNNPNFDPAFVFKDQGWKQMKKVD
jgi:hypothetical protein